MRHQISRRARGNVLSGAFALSCLLVVSACGGGSPGEAEAKENGKKEVAAVPVEVAAAVHRPVAASYTGTAPLEAPAESQVVAKTSGVALSVLVEEGDVVSAGQTLVRLDSSRAELQAAQTAAQMNKLQNQFARAEKLASEQLIAASDHDQIRYDLANARAANRLANLELSYANVKAPISGVVASVTPKPGNFVQINTPIVRIVDTSELEAVLNVPERELATLQQGLPVNLKVDALPGKTFEGTVDRISPVVDAGSGTFRVIAAFDSDGLLKPGMFGRISIDYDKRANALVVPRSALLEGTGDAAVFALRDGKVARVPVQLGYLDGEWAEIREGIKLGDRVVVAGKSALRDGSEVTVVGEPDKAQVVEAKGETAAAKQAAGQATAATNN
ncbi:efflux RND transporter periplasmic adaptor subunit [Novilysobacter erysipheiresistens]|uniref:Efflux RND transporter periplasmic adaptor subunit n=1 Tax=Novilysobacter erysipheiresistens TaxID=1749332 RepID=A0ABU7YVI2_9GAMM